MNLNLIDLIGNQVKLATQSRQEKSKRLLAEKKKTKLRWLKTEGRLVELDYRIKESLSVNRPNCQAAIVALDELSTLTIAPLMLKKHPYIVETILKLKRYIGPKESPEHTSEQKVFTLLPFFFLPLSSLSMNYHPSRLNTKKHLRRFATKHQ